MPINKRRAQRIRSGMPKRNRAYEIGDLVQLSDAAKQLSGVGSSEIDTGVVVGVSIVSDDDGIGYQYDVQFQDSNHENGWVGPDSQAFTSWEEDQLKAAR